MINELKAAIIADDKEKVRTLLVKISEEIAKGHADLINEITTPAVITELHSLLSEHLGVPPRTMMVKGRVTTRRGRASLFCRAMISGVDRVS